MRVLEKINERILAVYPTTKGFAYIIVDGEKGVIYWANSSSKDKSKLLKRFEDIINV